MIKIAMYTTIITLYKQKVTQRQIAKITKINRKTVSKIIKRYEQEGIDEPKIYQRESTLKQWHSQIVNLLEKNLSRVRIFQELKSRGYQSSYSSLTRYIKKHKIKDNSCIRFHTKPGEECQVDFGDIGLQYTPEGKKSKAYVFNMRLSYSRLDYYEVVFDQSIKTWIQCHINAFDFFGGTPEIIKLDNLKAGVIDANFYEPVYQKEYKRLAEHYDILLSPCRVYQPQEKGKVESGIKYVKNNFFAGRKFNSFFDLKVALEHWQKNANERIHGTTKKIPKELFKLEEVPCLKKLPIDAFDLSTWHTRKVAKDCHITIENNYYSVPAKYIACEVLIQVSSKILQIFTVSNELITRHERVLNNKGVFTTNPSHYGKYKLLIPGFIEYEKYRLKQMQNMGNNCKLFLEFLQKNSKDWHRVVKGIISLRKSYSDDLIDKACKRARYYDISSYSKIKNILENNAVNLPLPEYGGEYAGIN